MVSQDKKSAKRNLEFIFPLMWMATRGMNFVRCWVFGQHPSWVNTLVFRKNSPDPAAKILILLWKECNLN